MRTIFSLLLGAVMLGSLVSCDEENTGPQFGAEENPIETFINSLTFDGARVDGVTNFEFGLILEALEDGRITKLNLKMPEDGVYKVTLWDLSDTSIAVSSFIPVDSGEVQPQDMTDIVISAGDRLAVTVYSDVWYEYDNNGADIYPATAGSFKVLTYGFRYEPTDIQFPDQWFDPEANDHYYAGIAGFTFEPLLE